ncbi:unnamed protein product [Meloidogyne enterolobii]|uniref:Uncharacterized protein n=1 Tax=Meloidogyne enterolobii TaxID=390850 RepID=A0ACB0ZG32_MELEN
MYESAVCAPLVPAPPSHQLLTVFLHIIYFLFLVVILLFNLVVYRYAKNMQLKFLEFRRLRNGASPRR